MSGRVGPLKPSFINTYSLEFDGVDDYIDLSNADDLNFANDFTLSIWVKTSAIGSNQFIIDKSTSAFVGNGYSLRILDNGKVRFWSYSASNSLDSTTTLSADTWYHISATHDRSGAVNKIYINGALDVSGASGTFNPTINNLRIGTSAVLGNPFSGNLEEASFYGSELSASDILDIYNSGEPTDLSLLSTPPTAWYRMGDNGSYKSPQWLLPSNENKDKVSNYSFDFDGVDDYVDLGDLSELGGQSQVSISLWFKRSDNSNRFLLDFKEGSSRLAIQFYNTNTLYIYINGVSYNVALPSFALNTYYNLTYVFNGNGSTNADRLKLFIDGVNLIGGTYSATVPTAVGSFTSSMITRLGSLYINNFVWKGKIDEVSIFDSAISIGDVWDGSGQPIDVSSVSGIVSYYKMGEEATFSGGVWTVPDAVGSNDGTSNAMTIEDRVGSAPSSSNNAVSFNMDLIDRVEDTP